MLYFNTINRNIATGKATLQLTDKPVVETVRTINIPGVGERKTSSKTVQDLTFVLKSMSDGETGQPCRIDHPIWNELETGYKKNDPIDWVDIDRSSPVMNRVPVLGADGQETGQMELKPSTNMFWGTLASE
jgi:hypothetical protein|tara:strand:+ start:296 stop:688 length:393 start_codon:yes stop_codon:yes gene_type:complete